MFVSLTLLPCPLPFLKGKGKRLNVGNIPLIVLRGWVVENSKD
jgi:hypothetical protein